MNFWTLRHPIVDREGRCIGQTTLPTRMTRTAAVAQVVETAPMVPARIYSSDLPRCAVLAGDLAETWDCPLVLVPDIREMHFGEWEGRHYDEIDRNDGERWRAWCSDWQHRSPPDGESLREFAARIQNWVYAHSPEPNVLIVTHAGVIRALHVLAGTAWETAMTLQPSYLGWQHHTLPGKPIAHP